MAFSEDTTFIIFSNVLWSERNLVQHQVALELSRRYNVIYLNPPVLWDPTYRSRKYRRTFRVNGNLAVMYHKHVLPLRIFKRFFRVINDLITERSIRSYMRNSTEVVVWNFDRLRTSRFYLTNPSKVIYHVVHNKFGDAGDEELASSANMVLCSHSSYVNIYKAFNDKTIHFPPCIAQEQDHSSSRSDEYEISERYLAFVGELNQDLDIGLLKKFAEHNPETNIVLAGPVINREKWFLDQILELQKQPNIRMLGSVPVPSVPKLIKDADACLMPYRSGSESEIQNLYPQFMHDFLKYEKPVITTFDFGLPDNEKMGVKVCVSEEDFLTSTGSISEIRNSIDRTVVRNYLDSMTCTKKLEQLHSLMTRNS